MSHFDIDISRASITLELMSHFEIDVSRASLTME